MKKQPKLLPILLLLFFGFAVNSISAQSTCYIKANILKSSKNTPMEDVDVSAVVGSSTISSQTSDDSGIVYLQVPIGAEVSVLSTNQRYNATTTVSTATALPNDTIEVTLSIGPRSAGGTTAVGIIIMDEDKTKPAAGVALTLLSVDNRTVETATTATNGSFNFNTIKNGTTYKMRGIYNNNTVLDTTFTYSQGIPVVLSFPTK